MKKGHKPKEKKATKKTTKEIITKDDTPSSSIPASICVPPPSLVPPTTLEVIDIARSHCPATLMSITTDAFALSEYIARSAIQPDRHGIEPQALILPSSISAMLNVKEKTRDNASTWNQMLDFAQKVRSMFSSLVMVNFFHFTLSY